MGIEMVSLPMKSFHKAANPTIKLDCCSSTRLPIRRVHVHLYIVAISAHKHRSCLIELYIFAHGWLQAFLSVCRQFGYNTTAIIQLLVIFFCHCCLVLGINEILAPWSTGKCTEIRHTMFIAHYSLVCDQSTIFLFGIILIVVAIAKHFCCRSIRVCHLPIVDFH